MTICNDPNCPHKQFEKKAKEKNKMKMKWYFCNECQRYVQLPEDSLNLDCSECKTLMIETKRPREKSPNHTQFLQYIFEYFITNQIVHAKMIKDMYIEQMGEMDEEPNKDIMNMYKSQIYQLSLVKERLEHIDDIISNLRKYPQLKEMFFDTMYNNIPIKEFLMEKFPGVKLS